MPKAGALGFEFFMQTLDPAGIAKPGDLWWNGTTLRYRIGPPLSAEAWRDITTVAGTA